jgi:CPA1 family monovalent cation:H+ antiporter
VEIAGVLSLMDLAALLLTLCAIFAWATHKFLPLSRSVGLLIMSVVTSAALLGLDALFQNHHLFALLTGTLRQLDFTAIVMDGMLAFLLFAGALTVDLDRLRTRALPVALLAIFGTTISTALVGVAFWGAAHLAGYPLQFAWALVFGALISPTDPVAVLSTLRNFNVPPDLEIEAQGEALFNDGVGIVLFTILLRYAASDNAGITASGLTSFLLIEAGGGVVLGLITGTAAFLAMRFIDEYATEVLITIALVTATYAAAHHLHTSGPLAVVAAGLLIGDRGPRYAMSERTQKYVFALWQLVDEVLNSVLFLLIGLEALILTFEPRMLLLALAAIPIVLLGRLGAVSLQPLFFGWTKMLSWKNAPFLTWAGVRGGISIALVLSIPESPAKPLLALATYAVVLFSVIVQGSTLGIIAKHSLGLEERPRPE